MATFQLPLQPHHGCHHHQFIINRHHHVLYITLAETLWNFTITNINLNPLLKTWAGSFPIMLMCLTMVLKRSSTAVYYVDNYSIRSAI